ncbi:MAG: tRNA(His) guanylyltransferase Thg1 family protein [Methanoculleaceae archaeon]
MDRREIYSTIFAIPPAIIRLDGRAFHTLAVRMGLEKPYDTSFCRAMVEVCRQLISESGLNPRWAYTFSDEISLYFTDLPFGGRVEKLDSVSAAFAASALTGILRPPVPLAFDARIIPAATPEFVRDYLINRQQEAWRNHINACCQHALISEGRSPGEAAAILKGMKSAGMHEMMFARGVNLAETPAWQRRGVMVRTVPVEVRGYNPITGREVIAERRRLTVETDLPLFTTPEGGDYIRSLLDG